MFPKKLVVLILLFYSLPLIAQQPYYRHYTVNDGLASSSIYKIIQDRKGFIWIATENGAQRFDGKTFQTFSKETGLLDNTILDLFEDSKGRIWFLSLSGQIAYYDDGNIHTTANDSILKKVDAKSNLTYFLEDKKGTIYISAINEGLYKIDKSDVANYKSRFIKYIFTESDSIIKVGYAGGVEKLNNQKGFVLNYSFVENHSERIKSRDQISRMLKISEDTLLFFSNMGIFLLKKKGDRYLEEKLDFNLRSTTQNLFKSREDNCIWIATTKGAFLFDYRKSKIISSHLIDQVINSIFEDGEGNIWFGSVGNGIYYLNKNNFFSFTVQTGLTDNNLNDIILDKKKRLWLGYNNGEMKYLHNNKIFDYKMPSFSNFWGRINHLALDTESNILISSEVGIFQVDQNLKLNYFLDKNRYPNSSKIITPSKSVTAWEGSHGGIRLKYKGLEIGFRLSRISSLLEDKNNRLWIGEPSGLRRIEISDLSQHFQYLYDLFNKIPKNKTLYDSTLHTDLDIVSDMNYLNVQNGVNRKIDYSKYHIGLRTRISDIEESSNNTIWVATQGSGIFSIKNDSLIHQYSIEDGLSSNLGKVIKIENDSLIWLGTNKGLNRLSFSNHVLKVDVFNSANGLISDDVNAIELQGDTIWVATSGGLSFFNKNQISGNPASPPVYLTNVSINNSDTTLLTHYDLDFNHNSINLEFIGLSYQLPEKVSYKYKLDGVQSDWRYTSNNNIKYDYLPAGDYSFKVYAKSPDGVLSVSPAELSFHISPPFYQTWWFYLSVFTVISGMVSFAFWYRLRQIKKQDLLKLKIIEGELKALRAQMNPHFIFNSLNSIQYFISQSNTENAQKYLSKFSKLLRKILENSRQSSISLTDELEALKLYLEIESLRFNHRFDFSIAVSDDLDTESVFIPPMIFQPFVENAILHGIMPKKDAGTISVRIDWIENYMRCEIEDNGVGRQESAKVKSALKESHKSLGMSVTQERLESMTALLGEKASVEIIDKKNGEGISTGTVVRIQIPAEAVT